MDNIEKVKEIFETESLELLAEVEQYLLKLESDTENLEYLKQIFRNVHSVKGSAGMFGMEHTEYFLHEFEDLLDLLRDNKLEANEEVVDVILKAVDHSKRLVTLADDEIDEKLRALTDDIVAEIHAISQSDTQGGNGGSVQEVHWLVDLTFDPSMDDGQDSYIITHLAEIKGAKITFVPGRIPDLEHYEPSRVFGSWMISIPQNHITRDELEGIFDFAEHCEYAIDVGTSVTGKANPKANLSAKRSAAEEIALQHSQESADSDQQSTEEGMAEELETVTREETSIRVKLDVLEHLTNKVSELVLNRNQMLQYVRKNDDGLLNKYVSQLDKLTSEIQETTMNTRMQPVGNSWTRLPRIVRDLSRDLGKDVNLELVGESTELDRQIMQKLSEPIVHLIRNSVDHGIESAQERVEAGKSKTGTVRLSAYSSAGSIFIELYDDGKGLNAEKIKEKAISKGLVTAEEAATLDEKEIREFLFKPGFSTAGTVSKVSGRGVGLDVVKRNIESVGGQISIDSKAGEYTTFTIKIPLTLAVIPALTVNAGGMKFAISELFIHELVWLNEENIHKVRELQGNRVYQLRNRLVPIVDLKEVLSLNGSAADDSHGALADHYIVMIEGAESTFGILVDSVDEIQEIVVKPLSRALQHLSVYSGCTIVGSEQIVLILDVEGVAERAELSKETTVEELDEQTELIDSDTIRLLLFEHKGTQKAVPLDLVSRLEEFDRDQLEQIDDDYVIQYRNQVLPLIPYQDGILERLNERIPVLVLDDGEKFVGIIVEGFNDVVEQALDSNNLSAKAGVMSVEIINSKATEIIDLNWFYQKAKRVTLARSMGGRKGLSATAVIGSSFLRAHISHILSNLGIDVHAYRTAEEAGAFLESIEGTTDMVIVEPNPTTIQALESILNEQSNARQIRVLIGAETASDDLKAKFDLLIDDYDKNEILEKLAHYTTEDETITEKV